MKKIIDTVALILTIEAAIGLLGSYTAPLIDPNDFYPSSLLGLAYHYLLPANLLLLLYWLARWRRMALIELLVILAGYPFIRDYYGFASPSPAPAGEGFGLLSYNIRQMNLRGPASAQGIAAYVDTFPGDVACLQEYPRTKNATLPFPSYPHRRIHRDVAILSRRPLAGGGTVDFPPGSSAACVYADVVLPDDTVRIYCVHLESFRLGDKERRIYRQLTDGTSDDIPHGVHTILQRLVAANKRRAREAAILKAHADASPHPVVLCGDFNDTPISYTYHLLRRGMRNSFVEKGRGIGNTYVGEFPSFRIDHILHSPTLHSLSYQRDTLQFSDHYPIRTLLLP